MRQWMVLMATFVTLGADAQAAEPWNLVDESDGVKIWTRELTNSSIRELKAETVLTVAAERIWSVLLDVESYPEFMPHVVESKLLKKLPDGYIHYQRLDPPLVSERDFTVRVTHTTDADTGVYERVWKETDATDTKPRDGVVRMPINRGKWVLRQVDANKTKVLYYVHADVGGAIPDWIAGRANRISVPKMLVAVEKRARAQSVAASD